MTIETNATAVEQLTVKFQEITSTFVLHAEQNIEIARAMGDRETLIKEQNKMETMKTAVSIFNHCHTLVKQRGTQNG
jgi:hypothetical protein